MTKETIIILLMLLGAMLAFGILVNIQEAKSVECGDMNPKECDAI